jgi:hypothetical protein
MTRPELIAAYHQALKGAMEAKHDDAAFVLGVRLRSLELGLGAEPSGEQPGGKPATITEPAHD